MKHATLAAEPRTILGKKVATLRRVGKLPANIYGHNVESTAITLDAHSFGLLYRHLLPTTVIDLTIDGRTRPVLLAKTSFSPRTGHMIHVEFKQVNLRERVHATVPVVAVGEAPAVNRDGGLLLQSLDAVEVSGLPDELPASLELDISSLTDFHVSLHVRDIVVDGKKLEILTPGDDLIFKVSAPHLHTEEAEEGAATPEVATAANEGPSEA